jgi:hypothetical protein
MGVGNTPQNHRSLNTHDIEGHLEAYWKSPELLVVIASEQLNGW